MDIFAIPYKRAYASFVEFKTEVDEAYSANEQRNAAWTNGRMGWTLEFEKDYATTQAVREFFKAQKGRWKAFYFLWRKNHPQTGEFMGGDDKLYTVRFDTDKLELQHVSSGYNTFSIPLLQVGNAVMANYGTSFTLVEDTVAQWQTGTLEGLDVMTGSAYNGGVCVSWSGVTVSEDFQSAQSLIQAQNGAVEISGTPMTYFTSAGVYQPNVILFRPNTIKLSLVNAGVLSFDYTYYTNYTPPGSAEHCGFEELFLDDKPAPIWTSKQLIERNYPTLYDGSCSVTIPAGEHTLRFRGIQTSPNPVPNFNMRFLIDNLQITNVGAMAGSRVSPVYDISSVGIVKRSKVSWDETKPPDGTGDITVETSLDNGQTWQQCTNGGSVPGIKAGDLLTGKTLMVRETLRRTPDFNLACILYLNKVQIEIISTGDAVWVKD